MFTQLFVYCLQCPISCICLLPVGCCVVTSLVEGCCATGDVSVGCVSWRGSSSCQQRSYQDAASVAGRAATVAASGLAMPCNHCRARSGGYPPVHNSSPAASTGRPPAGSSFYFFLLLIREGGGGGHGSYLTWPTSHFPIDLNLDSISH